MALNRRRLRRSLFIDAKLQLRLLMPLGVLLLLMIVASGGFVFYPLFHNASHDPDPALRAILCE